MKIEDIENFEVFEDDIWIVTPPKCGTTWYQNFQNLFINKNNSNRGASKSVLNMTLDVI